jgi:heme/copper-type cytochrome/quinol oxidase subunit 2
MIGCCSQPHRPLTGGLNTTGRLDKDDVAMMMVVMMMMLVMMMLVMMVVTMVLMMMRMMGQEKAWAHQFWHPDLTSPLLGA